jgi:hypothetical protein
MAQDQTLPGKAATAATRSLGASARTSASQLVTLTVRTAPYSHLQLDGDLATDKAGRASHHTF